MQTGFGGIVIRPIAKLKTREPRRFKYVIADLIRNLVLNHETPSYIRAVAGCEIADQVRNDRALNKRINFISTQP
ncbi:MAG: hypothetical protein FWG38_09365, partial [Defluviitaleaceae bacterium]|nr:hypothetical protein [Defluviitaleaceae bacterium]